MRRLPKPILFGLVLIFFLGGLLIGYQELDSLLIRDWTDGFNIPEYIGSPYTVVNDNIPYFDTENIKNYPYEKYSELDKYGRCGVCISLIGKELMPTGERDSIGQVKPTGWHTVKYDFVDGKYLYNRCHLIGFQLTGENANEKNLITGTRYLNTKGMLPFENMVSDYIKETDNHVLYRVTPCFKNENLLAHGVLIEAYSVEDKGKGICFNVFCHNVQPGVKLDYATGQNDLDNSTCIKRENETEESFILNTSSKRIHKPECTGAGKISKKNKKEFSGYLSTLLNEGYKKCPECF